MLRKWNRLLAILLAFALVTTTFGSDFASARVYAVEGIEDVEPEGGDDLSELSFAEEVQEDESASEEEVQEEEAPVVAETEEERNEETPADGAPVDGTPAEETPAEPSEETPAEVDPTAPVDDEAAVDPANTVVDPDAVPADGKEIPAGEEVKEEKLVKVTYSATEGGSVSSTSEEININDEDAKFEGSTATADDGYIFVNWTDADGSEVSTSATFVPSGLDADASFTANFEAEEEEILEQKVTVSYKAVKGGRVTVSSETINILDETAKFEGATAEALNDAFEFVNWTDANDEEVSTEPTFVPNVKDITEDTTFVANFKATEKIVKYPALSEPDVHAGGLVVSVSADEGAFPEGTEVKIRGISQSQALGIAQSQLGDDVSSAVGVDISFWYTNEEGVESEIQPAADSFVHVSMEVEAQIEGTEFAVLHDHDGTVEQLDAKISTEATEEAKADPEDNTEAVTAVEFVVDEFSVFVVAGSLQPGVQYPVATYNFYDSLTATEPFNTQLIRENDVLKNPGQPGNVDTVNFEEFKGWYELDEENNFKSEPVAFDTAITGVVDGAEINIYAKIATTYYVTYVGPKKDVVGVATVDAIKGQDAVLENVYGISYTVSSSDDTFKGWSETPNGEIIDKKENKLTIHKNTKLYAVVFSAYYVRFDENDDIYDSHGNKIESGGADYHAPIAVKKGEAPYTGIEEDVDVSSLTNMYPAITRPGYTFKGWYTDTALTKPFNWSTPRNEDITVYAKWEEAKDTKYTIIVWKQKVTDGINATEKHYDLAVYSTPSATTGQSIKVSSKNNKPSVSVNNRNVNIPSTTTDGFKFSKIDVNGESSSTINARGTTVVNVYYDRNVVTLNFYLQGQYNVETDWFGNVTSIEKKHNAKAYKTLTGLFEQPITNWPSEYSWYGISFMDKFDLSTVAGSASSTSHDFFQIATGNATYEFFKQNEDCETYSDAPTDTIRFTGGSSTGWKILKKYEGFEVDEYRTKDYWGNWSQWSKNIPDDYVGGYGLQVHHKRSKFAITFMDGTEPVSVDAAFSTIPYDVNIKNYLDSKEVDIPKLPDKNGYKFVGWFEGEGGISLFDFNSKMPVNGKILYAYYAPIRYTINLHPGEGTVDGKTEVASFNEDYGNTVDRASIDARVSYQSSTGEAYDFVGWYYYDGAQNTEAYIFDSVEKTFRETGAEDDYVYNEADKKWYAQIHIVPKWRYPGQVYIKYELTSKDGVSGIEGSAPENDGYGYAFGSDVVVDRPCQAPTLDGKAYKFIGWTIKKDDSGKIYYQNNSAKVQREFVVKQDIVVDGELKKDAYVMTFVPVFEAPGTGSNETTTITFDPNGGTGTAKTYNLRKNESMAAPSNINADFSFERTHWAFKGWSKVSGQNNDAIYITTADIAAGKKIAANNEDFDATHNTLYAVWEKINLTYDVKYYKGDDIANATFITTATDASFTIESDVFESNVSEYGMGIILSKGKAKGNLDWTEANPGVGYSSGEEIDVIENNDGSFTVRVLYKPIAFTIKITTKQDTPTYDGTLHDAVVSVASLDDTITADRGSIFYNGVVLDDATRVYATTVSDNNKSYSNKKLDITKFTYVTANGGYKASFVFADGEEESEHSVTIQKRAITVTANSKTDFVYDGTEKEVTGATVTSGSLVTGQDMTATLTNNKRTNEGSQAVAVGTVTIKNGEEDVTGNYDITKAPGTLKIAKASADSIGLTANGFDVEYDGQSHAVTASATADGTTISYKVGDGNWQTYAPSYINVIDETEVQVRAENPNYDTKTITVKVRIYKRAITVTANSKTDFVYDGTEKEVTGATVTSGSLVTGQDMTATLTNNKRTNEGSQAVAVGTVTIKNGEEDVTGNYDITKAPGTLKIAKASADSIGLTANGFDVEYDGQSHAVTASATADGTTISYKVGDGNWQTYAPSYINVIDETEVQVRAENPNYDTKTITVKVRIYKRAITVTANSKTDFVYDGTEKEVTGATVTSGSLVTGQDMTATLTNNKRTNEGSQAVAVGTVTIKNGEEDVTGNYDITKAPGTLKIAKASADSIGLTANGFDVEYDGQSHAVTASATADGTTISYKVGDGNWQTYAPSYINVIDETEVQVRAENPNYDTKTITVKVRIYKRAITVTANSKTDFVYDGTEKEVTGATVTSGSLVTGQDMTATLTNNKRTNEGSQAVAVGTVTIKNGEEDVTGNYDITKAPGTLKIAKASADSIGLTANGFDVEYDGQSHAVTASATADGTTISYKVGDGNWQTYAPSYINVIDETEVQVRAENPNYDTKTITVKVRIYKRAITVTANSKTDFVYDGTEKEVTGATVTSGSLVTGQDMTATLTNNKRTNEGSQAVAVGTVTIKNGEEDVTGNYDITKAPGTLKIAKASGEALGLQATGHSDVYDGNTYYVTASTTVTEDTTIEYSVDNGQTWTADAPSIRNVGKQNVVVKATNPNYEEATKKVVLEVTPLAITLTVADAQKTYGDEDPEFEIKSEDLAKLVEGDVIDYTITRKNAGVEDAGTYEKVLVATATETTGDDAGTANYANGNYKITFVPGDFVINKAGAEGIGLRADGFSVVYNGEEHSITASYNENLTKRTTLSYSTDGETWGSNPKFVNVVDGQTVYVKAENDNFETATAQATATITKRPITVVAGRAVGDVQEFTFNGKPQSAVGYYVVEATEDTGLVSGQNLTAAIENNTYTKPGNYEFNITDGSVTITEGLIIKKSVTDNYDIQTVLGAMRIKSRKDSGEQYPITVFADDVTVTYNGKIQTYTTGYGVSSDTEDVTLVEMIWNALTNLFTLRSTAAAGMAFDVEGVTYTLSGVTITASGKDVNSYNFIATGEPLITTVIDGEDFPVTDEFTIDYQLGKLIIEKAAATVTAIPGLSKTAGAADPVFDATVAAINSALNAEAQSTIRYAIAREPGETAGTYNVVPSGEAEQGNFKVTYVPSIFTINAAPAPAPTPAPAGDPGTPAAPAAPAAPAPAPAPAAAVLGATREPEAATDGAAVLGARRGRTEDEANSSARVFAIVIAAAAAIAMMLTGKKKEEED